LPCLADPNKIRFIAYADRDISEMLPYLNTKIEKAIYNHAGHTMTIKKEGRLIGITGRQIAGGKIIDEADAREILKWLKDLTNYCYENKEKIEPDYERRRKLSALDIYKLLPGTNCKQCGKLTCLAFAVNLSEEEINVMKCYEIFRGEYAQKRKELFRVLKNAGYGVPEVFTNEEA